MTTPAIHGITVGEGFVLGKSQAIDHNVFEVQDDGTGLIFYPVIKKTGEVLIADPTDPSNKIMKEITKFLDSKELYDKFHVNHKRGIVLYGPPGTGKTATVRMLTDLFVAKTDGWVITNAADIDLRGTVSVIRKEEPTKALLVVFDDVVPHSITPNLLAFMDGQENISNLVFLFTTNYFGALPAALKRPSRTDLHVEIIGMTDASAASYCKMKFFDDDFKSVKAAFSRNKIAVTYSVLKEVMLLKHIYGLTPIEALKRIKSSGADFTTEVESDDSDEG